MTNDLSFVLVADSVISSSSTFSSPTVTVDQDLPVLVVDITQGELLFVEVSQ